MGQEAQDGNSSVTGIAWPVVALILGIVVLLLFRAELRSLLSRVTSIEKLGIKTTALDDQTAETRDGKIQPQLPALNGPPAQAYEAKINDELKQRKLEVKSECERFLVSSLASSMAIQEFERIYYLIFGSQIYVLRQLNQHPGGTSREMLNVVFEDVKQRNADVLGSWNLDTYLEFLLKSEVVEVSESRYAITAKGRNFLVWMTQSGARENKAL